MPVIYKICGDKPVDKCLHLPNGNLEVPDMESAIGSLVSTERKMRAQYSSEEQCALVVKSKLF